MWQPSRKILQYEILRLLFKAAMSLFELKLMSWFRERSIKQEEIVLFSERNIRRASKISSVIVPIPARFKRNSARVRGIKYKVMNNEAISSGEI